MVDMVTGVLGHHVASHVEEGSSNALVPAPTLNQQRENWTVVDSDQLPKQGDVTPNLAQAKIVLLSYNSTNPLTS